MFTDEVGDFCMPSCTRYIQWSTTVFCSSDIKVGTFFDKQFSCLQFASSGGAMQCAGITNSRQAFRGVSGRGGPARINRVLLVGFHIPRNGLIDCFADGIVRGNIAFALASESECVSCYRVFTVVVKGVAGK